MDGVAWMGSFRFGRLDVGWFVVFGGYGVLLIGAFCLGTLVLVV